MYDIERLKSELLFMKIEINSNYKTMSASQIQDLVEERLNKKKELHRLILLNERKNKILKIKSKI